MSNIVIYTDNNSEDIKKLCKDTEEAEITVKPVSELINVTEDIGDIIVTDAPSSKLKELSEIMKFPLPLLYIAEENPYNIKIRGEAFDYVVKPVNEYDFALRLKNFIKIKALKDKIVNISTFDDLTGLHNRKFLAERIESETARARRYRSSLSCVLFDIDFFKVVNDMYGYECGDKLLRKIADMLKNLARKEDIVTRYGDEEFLVLLPDTSEENAYIFAERFRRDVEKAEFYPDGEDEPHPVKISGGIAEFPYLGDYDDNADTLIRYAEHALYNAKTHGKNKVVLFSKVNMDF